MLLLYAGLIKLLERKEDLLAAVVRLLNTATFQHMPDLWHAAAFHLQAMALS